MARKIAQTIDFDGPFFERDPVKTFRRNLRDLMDVFAAEGEDDVVAQLRVGEPGRAPVRTIRGHPRVSANVVGRTVSLRGRRWATVAKVSVNNSGLTPAEGISLMAAASAVEGQTHAFARTARRLRRVGKQIDLFKGLD